MKHIKSFENYINENIIGLNNVFVYHRTRSKTMLDKIINDGFKKGPINLFMKEAVHTSYDLNGLLNEHAEMIHGKYIIKSKISNLEKFLILNKELAKNYYGTDSIKKQLESVYIKKDIIKDIVRQFEEIDNKYEDKIVGMRNGNNSSKLSYIKHKHNDVFNYFNGVIFEIKIPSIAFFNENVIVPVSWTSTENGKLCNEWIPVNRDTIKNNIKKAVPSYMKSVADPKSNPTDFLDYEIRSSLDDERNNKYY